MEELKAQMKPFSFVKREEARRRAHLSYSSPELRDCERCFKPFRAKPVPRNLFSNYVYQKRREDEFYRYISVKTTLRFNIISKLLGNGFSAHSGLAPLQTNFSNFAYHRRLLKHVVNDLPNDVHN